MTSFYSQPLSFFIVGIKYCTFVVTYIHAFQIISPATLGATIVQPCWDQPLTGPPFALQLPTSLPYFLLYMTWNPWSIVIIFQPHSLNWLLDICTYISQFSNFPIFQLFIWHHIQLHNIISYIPYAAFYIPMMIL